MRIGVEMRPDLAEDRSPVALLRRGNVRHGRDVPMILQFEGAYTARIRKLDGRVFSAIIAKFCSPLTLAGVPC
jgi:hypothetical protein